MESPRDITALPEQVVINCTGLGSKALFNDPDLVPLKGQLIVLEPQPEVQYGCNGGSLIQAPEGSLGIHMMPRSDGIALGGTSQRDVWTMDIDEKERMRVVDGHIQFFRSIANQPI
jgi:glycine/D-amino acid oxidase-like deaminating enzyme